MWPPPCSEGASGASTTTPLLLLLLSPSNLHVIVIYGRERENMAGR